MKVGLMGGTFDPIHIGHLLVAEEARLCLEFDEVLFIPTGNPWMKAGTPLSPAHHRLNMVRLAVASNPFFHASSIEIDRPGPTYTVDTLAQLREGGDNEDSFYFIVGVDSLSGLRRWKEPERVLDLCTMVVVPRPGHPTGDMSFLESICLSESEKVLTLNGPLVDVSGTDIRSRVAMGQSVRYQVPEEVESYMARCDLYRESGVAQ